MYIRLISNIFIDVLCLRYGKFKITKQLRFLIVLMELLDVENK